MPINKGISEDTTYNHTTKGGKEKRNKREIFGCSGRASPFNWRPQQKPQMG